MLNFPWSRRVVPRIDKQKERTPFLERRLGVWRLLIADDESSSFRFPNFQWGLGRISSHIPLLTRAYKDMYSISPTSFWLMIATHLWYAIEDPLSLYFSNRLLLLVGELFLTDVSCIDCARRFNARFRKARFTLVWTKIYV
jgi:hypothetical protein